MKIDAFKKKDYVFTADLWKFTTTTDASGGEVFHYSFDRTISLIVVTGIFGKLTCYFQDSESDIVLNDQLMQIKDAAGSELNPGYVWKIDQFVPNINVWGHREGFKGRISFIAIAGG
jgi:hypothetical protein